MRLSVLAAALLCAGCPGVPSQAVRAWATPNFKQYVNLVDEKYSSEETRLNHYKSLAALICNADTADGAQATSPSCRCERATSDEALKTACSEFIQQYR